MGVKRIGNSDYKKVRSKSGRLVYVLRNKKHSHGHSDRNITARDRAIDTENGRDAKGSHWDKDIVNKIHRDIHKAEDRNITEHDREIDRENGRDAKGW